MSNLKTDEAAGPDMIKPIVLKELRDEITSFILFQKSLTTGQVLKDCSTTIVSNKFKNIIASKNARHFNSHQIVYEFQHGFREKRSCETQLIQLAE